MSTGQSLLDRAQRRPNPALPAATLLGCPMPRVPPLPAPVRKVGAPLAAIIGLGTLVGADPDPADRGRTRAARCWASGWPPPRWPWWCCLLPVAGPLGARTAAAAGDGVPVGMRRSRCWCRSLVEQVIDSSLTGSGPAAAGAPGAEATASFATVAIGAPGDRGGRQGPVPAADDDRAATHRTEHPHRLPGVRRASPRPGSPGWRTSSTSPTARPSADRWRWRACDW